MLDKIKDTLKKAHQNHLFNFYDDLNKDEQRHLLNQLKRIDFKLLNHLYKNISKKEAKYLISPMDSIKATKEHFNLGVEALKRGEYAVVTMAGGQGTRLGFEGPKGTYKLGYKINKSLFEIQVDKLKEIFKKYHKYLNWYIMTSNDNYKATLNFFIKHHYFGYPKEYVSFFIQDELPMLDLNGKIIMDSKFNIKMGANGSGGVFSSLKNSGLLAKMKKSNLKWVFIGGIDNILLPTDNPDLIGFAIKENCLAVSKIVKKLYPKEKVGLFVKKDNQPAVIEYIEMSEEMNNLKDDQGNLVYGDAHILCNLFNIKLLEKVANKKLKYMAALKKASYINDKGLLIEPIKENAYKFETFIFDAFSYTDKVGLLIEKRERIFAPIKNKKGEDSPQTASKLYLNYYNKLKGRDR